METTLDTTATAPDVQALTREQFEIRLDHIEMEQMRAMKSMKTLQLIKPSPREIAMQMTINAMVEDLIMQLMTEANVTVEFSREDSVGRVPCPPILNRRQTLLNFDNQR